MKKLVAGLGLMMFSSLASAFTYTLEITEEELQSKVEAMMPIEKKKFFVTVVLSAPDVDLKVGDDLIGLSTNIHVAAPGGVNGEGNAKITGTLRYEANAAAFYFDNPRVVKLDSKNISPDVLPMVKELSQLAVSKILEVKPVYKLTDDKLKHKLAKSMLLSVKVENNLLLVELSAF